MNAMEHMPENYPMNIKKWWRLRNSLENRDSMTENENSVAAQKSFNSKTEESSNRKLTETSSSETDVSAIKHTDSYVAELNCANESVHAEEDITIKQKDLRDVSTPPNSKTLEMDKEVAFHKDFREDGLFLEGGISHFSCCYTNMDNTWNQFVSLPPMYGSTVNPIIFPSRYTSKENIDIPPLIRFVQYCDWERPVWFLQHRDNHSFYGAEEIKYHLTRKDNSHFRARSTESADASFKGHHFDQNAYRGLPSMPNPPIRKTGSMEWSVSNSCEGPLVENLLSGSVDSSHVCNVCGKAFNQKRYLLNHLSIHSGEKRYLCEICNKNFSHKSNLVKHLKVHSGERPYSCEMCEKRFVQKIHLVNHMTVHSGERPYLCHICQKRFSYKSNLVKHIKLHSGKKPFACNTCDKRFTQKVNLTMHLKLHEKGPFTCSICHKRFLYESSLTKHIVAHNGDKPYICEICGKKFIQKANLAKHLKVHKQDIC